MGLGVFRRLEFGGGDKDQAARVHLASLGLVALTSLHRDGGHLRSECDLVCDESEGWRIRRDDRDDEALEGVTVERTLEVTREALRRARAAGLAYRDEPIELEAHKNLAKAVGSREE